MSDTELKFLVVDTLPTSNFHPGAIYLYKETGAAQAQMYRANNAGTALVKFSDSVDIKKTLMHRGDEPPVNGSGHVLWYKTDEYTLFLNMPEDGNDIWVEATALQALPEFAGNGTATTMSRSDHTHEGFMVENPAW